MKRGFFVYFGFEICATYPMRQLLPILGLFVLMSCSVQKYFDRGEYDTVILKLNADANKNSPEENFMMGESYRLSNRLANSLEYYSAAMKANYKHDALPLYYARALRANDLLKQSEGVLEIFVTSTRDEVLQAQAERELANIRKFEEMKEKTSFYRVKNLEDINTGAAEYSPVYSNGYLYFTSNREGSKIYKTTGTPFTDIYRVGSRGANVNLSTLKALDPVINDPNVNEGSIAISPDAEWIIFARGNSGKATGNNNVNLFFSRFRNGQWSDPRPLPINEANAWDSTPTIAPDGVTLYFSSTREGGYGGADLYTAKLDRRGRWVDVRNLGPEINTHGNEMFPFISPDGKLYFSSDGHPGFGGLDIFTATRVGGKIEIENLGEPMNSPADDFGMFLFDMTRGFFSSNRKGGKGDDDIYTFVNEDPTLRVVNYFLAGTTVTSDDGGNEIILPNTKVRLVDEEGKPVDEAFTGEDGRFKFRVYPEENYNLIGEKTDYFSTRKTFSTMGKTVDKTTLTEFITNVNFETKIQMDRIVLEKPIVMKDIFYDFDRAEIRPDAARRLDSLVMILNDNPDIFIELGSHTDARGEDDYNMDLSRRRAISAVRYIIGKGINADRISARGYGESRLLIPNAKTEEEHQINRRTEFKVLKYNPRNREDALPLTDEEKDEYDRFFKVGDQ
jgi:peptidoglycan-associated lipoprotein